MGTISTTPRCPQCGFTVFNRRYPKCESCGRPLPESLVLSKEQLQVVLKQENAERNARRERETLLESRIASDDSPSAGSLMDDILDIAGDGADAGFDLDS